MRVPLVRTGGRTPNYRRVQHKIKPDVGKIRQIKLQLAKMATFTAGSQTFTYLSIKVFRRLRNRFSLKKLVVVHLICKILLLNLDLGTTNGITETGRDSFIELICFFKKLRAVGVIGDHHPI